jgi:hypothetical protein
MICCRLMLEVVLLLWHCSIDWHATGLLRIAALEARAANGCAAFEAQKIVDNTNGLICVFTTGKLHCYENASAAQLIKEWQLPNGPTVFHLASMFEKRAMLTLFHDYVGRMQRYQFCQSFVIRILRPTSYLLRFTASATPWLRLFKDPRCDVMKHLSAVLIA